MLSALRSDRRAVQRLAKLIAEPIKLTGKQALGEALRMLAFSLAPSTMLYLWFLGSVWISMRRWQQGARMVKAHILVL